MSLPEKDSGPEYRFPQFLCIGAQKAGTTWLDRNLRRHARLWLPPIKELHYFNEIHVEKHIVWTVRHRRKHGATILQRYLEQNSKDDYDYRLIGRLADIADGHLSDDWYGRIFSLAPSDQICGEVSPDYYLLPEEGIAHVLRLSPDVKIILSLRDPIERSWSHVRMMMKMRKLDGVSDAEVMASTPDMIRRADYATIIARWLRFVPKENFLVLFLDDIATAPGEVMKTVCSFLNVKYRPKVFAKASRAVHVGEERAMPPSVLEILKKNHEPAYDGLVSLYPEVGTRWVAKHY